MRQLIILVYFAFFSALIAFGQTLHNDPSVQAGQLPSGLHYYIQSYRGEPGKASLYLVSKAGSLIEQDDQSGYASFLARLHAAGGGAMDADDIQTLWLKLTQETSQLVQPGYIANVYKIPVIVHPSIVGDVLDFFSGVIQPAALDSIAFNKLHQQVMAEMEEKKLHVRERVMGQLVPFQLQDPYYAARPTAGTMETIGAMSLVKLADFATQVSDPSNFAVIVVGDLDADTLLRDMEKRFAHLRTKTPLNLAPANPIHAPANPAYTCITDSAVSQVTINISVGLPETGKADMAGIKRAKTFELMNEVMKTAFSDLSAKDSCFSNASFRHMRVEYGLEQLALNVDTEAASVKECVSTTYKLLHSFGTEGIPAPLMEAARNNIATRDKQLFDARDRLYNRFLADRLVNRYLYGYPQPDMASYYDQQVAALGEVTDAEVKQRLTDFMGGAKRMFIIAPKSEESRLPTEKELMNWITINQ